MKIYLAKHILPVSCPPISEAAMAVENGKIMGVGSRNDIVTRYPEAETLDCGNAVIIPGLINAHAQLDLLTSNLDWKTDSYVESLLGLIEYKRSLQEGGRRDSIQTGLKRALSTGTTTIADSGAYFELNDVVGNLPIRILANSELLLSSEDDIQKNFEASLRFVDDLNAINNEKHFAGIAPFAPYMVSRHLLKVLTQHSEESAIPLHIHVAESFAEMQFFFDSTGEMKDILFKNVGWKDESPPLHRKTPIEFLASIGFLETAPALVGCIHLSESDLSQIYASGGSVVHCPRSNKVLNLGKAPVQKILEAKIPVALGTDLSFNNESLSMWDEMRETLKMHSDVSGTDVLRMATLSGAKALRLDKTLGSLDVGKKADFLVVSTQAKVDTDELPASLIKYTQERNIKSVYIGGKKVQDVYGS